MNRFRQDKSPPDNARKEQTSPLRDFNHEEAEPPSLLRLRISRVAYWLVPLLVFTVMIVAGVLVALRMSTKSDSSALNNEQGTLRVSVDELSVPELMEAHLSAIGGREALNSVRSVRYEGKVRFSAEENDFQMLLMLPDKGMLVTNPDEQSSLKLMLNGDTVWQVIDMRNGEREVVALDEEATDSLKWSMKVHNTFRKLALEQQFTGIKVREVQYQGKSCYEFTKTMPDGSEFLAVLDLETLYLLKTEESIVRENEVDRFTVFYDDYRMVSNLVEPYFTKLLLNGEPDNEVRVDSIRINPGVLSSLFEIPEQIKDQQHLLDTSR